MMTASIATENIQLWSDVTETPNLKKNQIVFTAGSTVIIDAPAKEVFEVIISVSKYHEWNRWCPKFELENGQDRLAPGAKGVMHVSMEAQNRTFEIPEEILEFESESDQHKISWKGGLLPSWIGKAERVQIVTTLEGSNGKKSQLKQWESMSGFASYLFKYAMGVPKQLQDSNLLYSEDIKKRAEDLHKSKSTSQ